MKRTFLVTGYPRTRGTWLAAYLSSGDTLCLHEPILAVGKSFPAMVDYVASLPHRNVGISDSCIPSMRSLFALVYRDSPVLVVERPKAVCLSSLLKYYGINDGPEMCRAGKVFDETERGLQSLEEHFRTVKRISFDSLATLEGARTAWEFCCPGEPFDQHRYQAMDRIVCNPKI